MGGSRAFSLAFDRQPALQWRMPALTHPQKITFGEMRSSGVRGILIYCADYKCSDSIATAQTNGLIMSGSRRGASLKKYKVVR